MATNKKAGAVTGAKAVPPVLPKAVAKPVTVAAPSVAAKKAVAKAVPKPAAKASSTAAAPPVAAVLAPPPAKAKVSAKKKAASPAKVISPEQRANYIEVAAFYIAERRGFAPGNPEQDYLDAAAEIDRLISGGHFAR
jgi:hypothetical protein